MYDKLMPQKPLTGRTILIACSAKKLPELVAGVEAMGGSALPFPIIEAQEIADNVSLDSALKSLSQYTWIIFTSSYGVSFFMKRLNELGIAIPTHGKPQICAIGPATAKTAMESGLTPDLIPEEFIAEGVIRALSKRHGGLEKLASHRILLPRALVAREILPEALSEAGIHVDVVPCYQTIRLDPDSAILKKMREKNLDLILFTSSSGIRSFVDILGESDGKELLLHSAVAVIGPITYKTAESFGKRPEILPKKNTIDSLLEAIREYYNCRNETVRDRR